MLRPAVDEHKGQLPLQAEQLVDGLRHGLREGRLVPALVGRNDAGLVAQVNFALRVRPLADADHDVAPHPLTEQCPHLSQYLMQPLRKAILVENI